MPLVEELFWRGLVFSILLGALSTVFAVRASTNWAVWLSGIAFGLLHAGNALAGVPLQFVAIQTLSVVVWGVMYGYARARTGSVYPPLLLHGAMNFFWSWRSSRPGARLATRRVCPGGPALGASCPELGHAAGSWSRCLLPPSRFP